ncbi:MAG: class I SAM-dependent methyltransferase [Janthinobacterium lividum]
MSQTGEAAGSIEQVKQSMRATWMAGDFGVIARTIAGGAAAFADRLKLAPGARVLDVATGTGNVALPLALAGYAVSGVDIAPNLLEQARERAAAASVSIQFDEGDAEALPYADASFDAVVTMFGAMFAPRPALVAAELARVLRPGGLLAMANWNPASFSGAMFRTGGKHAPPPLGVPAPVLWGDPDTVNQRLADNFESIRTELIPIAFDMPMPPSGAVNLFRTYFGPTKMAFARLDDEGQAALQSDLLVLWTSANVAADKDARTLIRNEYLQVLATRL